MMISGVFRFLRNPVELKNPHKKKIPGIIKRSVRVTLSDPPCKDDHARFTTVSLKPLSNQ